MVNLTRRRFVNRTLAAVGGTFAYAALPPEPALASAYCRSVDYAPPGICLSGTTSTCRVQYGPPSCTSSSVTVYSPNNRFEQECTAYCPGGKCSCEPLYFQARAATANSGACSCTIVI
jgi:hypothetical protein